VARATLVGVHAGDLDRLRNRVGLILLFAMEIFCNWAAREHGGHRMFLIGYLAWMLMVYILVMCVWVLWESSKLDEPAEEADPAAT